MKDRYFVPFFRFTILAALLTLVIPLALGGGRTARAAAQAEEKILVSISDESWNDDTLYTLNPDGSGQTLLFDFHSHPKDPAARIYQPRVAPGGGSIYFSSNAAYLYTPARRNLFRIASDGSWWDQITPDSNSGLWNQPGPYGVVEGTVEQGDGTPWINSPIYLEGMDVQSSGADGSFRFENVPEGKRWIVAYKPGDATAFDAQEIFVANGAPWNAKLIPGSDAYLEFQHPRLYEDRIYHTPALNSIQYTDINASSFTTVYQVSGSCTFPQVSGFDVGSQTGKLVIMDYATGCPTNRGLYTADKDGNNLQVLVDMKTAGTNWCGAGDVFWSPDESKVAFEACYDFGAGWQTHLFVYDASTGGYLGGVTFPNTSYTLVNVTLHGWSPNGDWLLYSYWLDAANTALEKIPVNSDGSLNAGNIVSLLTNVRLSGATWGELGAAACTVPLSGVTISGPTSGSPSTAYTFNASVSPANASSPITYTWSPAPGSGQGSSSAQYTWSTTGVQTISVTATNCSSGGTASDTHTININDSPGGNYKVYISLILR
jgi:hypothetical protein